MTQINPKKLLNSKWTARKPINKEKHFIVVRLDYDAADNLVDCLLEAVISKRRSHINWRQLQDTEQWLAGWK